MYIKHRPSRFYTYKVDFTTFYKYTNFLSKEIDTRFTVVVQSDEFEEEYFFNQSSMSLKVREEKVGR